MHSIVMMETLGKKLIFMLALISLTACGSDRNDSSRQVLSTKTMGKPVVLEGKGYKLAKGSVQIDGVSVNFDADTKNLSLTGKLLINDVKSGKVNNVDINLFGAVGADGFAALKSVDTMNSDIKIAAKATCLGSDGDCHSSFIDIYIQSGEIIYHHQVESIAEDFGNDEDDFDPSMATEGGNDGVDDTEVGGFIGDISSDIKTLFEIKDTESEAEQAGNNTGSSSEDSELSDEIKKIRAELEAAQAQAKKAQEDVARAQAAAEKAKQQAIKAQQDSLKAKQEAAAAAALVDKAKAEAAQVKQQLKKSQDELTKAKQETLKAKQLLEQAELAKRQGEEVKAKQLTEQAKVAQKKAAESELAAKKAQDEATKKQLEIDKARAQAEKEQKAREAAAKAKAEAEVRAQSEAKERAKAEAEARAKAEAQEEARKKKEQEAKEKARQEQQGSKKSEGAGNSEKPSQDVNSGVQVNKISQAIGAVNKGRLENAVNIKNFFEQHSKRGVDVIRPERRAYYGTNELTHVLDIISKLSYTLTPGYKSAIGDISREKGGKLFRHKSHQNGVDADVAFYFKNKTFQGYLASAIAVNKLHPDWMYEQQWTMFKRIQETGFIDRIFIHPLMKKKLCEHAINLGELKKNDTKSLAAQTLRRLIPEKDHHDHYHLRVKCSSAQVRCRQMADPPQGSGCF